MCCPIHPDARSPAYAAITPYLAVLFRFVSFSTGDWLLLKNLHLVVSWLPLLEKEVHNLPSERHDGFRLFLTTQPHAKFPATLLESSLKVSCYVYFWFLSDDSY